MKAEEFMTKLKPLKKSMRRYSPPDIRDVMSKSAANSASFFQCRVQIQHKGDHPGICSRRQLFCYLLLNECD